MKKKDEVFNIIEKIVEVRICKFFHLIVNAKILVFNRWHLFKKVHNPIFYKVHIWPHQNENGVCVRTTFNVITNV